MTKTRLTVSGAAALMAATAFVGSAQRAVGAQSQAPLKLAGVLNDYVEGFGAWHVNGEWTVHAKGDSGQADFSASLTMLRSDLWVLLTLADPTNPALRTPHTHYVSLLDGVVTAIADGWRISGPATVTTNGSVGFSGSAIDIDITGGNALPSSNVKLTFSGPATLHFGTQPIDGVVVFGR